MTGMTHLKKKATEVY